MYSLVCGNITNLCLPFHMTFFSVAPLRTPSLDLGPTLIQYDFSLNWLCLQRPYFQIRLRSQVPEILKFHNFPWGPSSTNNFRITELHFTLCYILGFIVEIFTLQQTLQNLAKTTNEDLIYIFSTRPEVNISGFVCCFVTAVQSLSGVQVLATPWTVEHQAL